MLGLTNSKVPFINGDFITLNNSLFIHKSHDHLLLLLVYDDMLVIGSNSSLIQSIIHDLNFEFALKTLGFVSCFLGFEAHSSSAGLHLN